MRLSREEFWILDTTVPWNSHLPLPYLNRSDADLFFNKRRHHGLSEDDLIDLLVLMQRQGDLTVFQMSENLFPSEMDWVHRSFRTPGIRFVCDFTPVWDNPCFYSKTAIVDDFHVYAETKRANPRAGYPKEMLHYCMSPQGAEKWEETAQVDWNKYLDTKGYCSTPKNPDVTGNMSEYRYRAGALTKQHLDAYFDWQIRWDAHPDSHEWKCFRRYATEKISPWRATYWKTFPEGYECDVTELRLHRRRRMNKSESKRYHEFYERYWSEHHALFDWHNRYKKDFPFEGD